VPVASVDLDRTGNGDIREQVRGLLAGGDRLLGYDAVQVVDELVSNAHRHGRSPRRCRFFLDDWGNCLRVEVDDAAPELPRFRPVDATGGRGLILVDKLAMAWGVRRDAGHKTVWADLAVRRD
jgi:hypothetical protein